MRSLAVTATLLLALPTVILAQEEPQGMKWTDIEWYEVIEIDFKAGKAAAAIDLIEQQFRPTSRAAGTPLPVMILEHETGAWDLTVIWHRAEGPSFMEWQQSPNNQKWWAKLVERAGGESAAQALWDEYQSYIARTNSYIARKRT
ncbi:MAG: hypothetical protein JSV95_13480 [Gemmatimonadota bacterium]|jgi:hypothetical protein|nr:MAG: hypothetical protein JSV95_13480 [Gemmatimonadota bacterium]